MEERNGNRSLACGYAEPINLRLDATLSLASRLRESWDIRYRLFVCLTSVPVPVLVVELEALAYCWRVLGSCLSLANKDILINRGATCKAAMESAKMVPAK
ncbi:hypothetical protein KCU88_g182, partial [Aureobasidium melanogenum]